ncbi:MAG TPA: GGDEF domain-containing protein [Coprothermobacter proteolyticus]|nr:GGDEF domain-containing protein [Coprothermobacter proteolyticus]
MLQEWEGLLQNTKGIVFIDIPTGKGRTYTLKQLKKVCKVKSLYSLYYSPLTGVGQLFFDLLNGVREDFLEEFPEHGPVIRRYLHHRFYPALSSFKPYRPLTVSQEQTLLLSAMVDLVRASGIKYWFIDDWLQDDYNYLFSVVLPELVAATDITVVVVGDAFPREWAETVLENSSLDAFFGDDCLAKYCRTFGFSEQDIEKMISETEGNWHELLFLCQTRATNLSDALKKAMSALPEQACDLLNGFAVMAERNSAFIKDILLGEQRDYSALEKLEQLHLVFWESPLYRFPSPRVRELVRERIPQSEQKAILESVTDAMAKVGYSDYWGRIATRYRTLGKRKKEAFALLMELREKKGTAEVMKTIDRLDQLGVNGPGYRRLKSLCQYWTNDLQGAVETLKALKNPNLVDLANLIRFLSYSGQIAEADRLASGLLRDREVIYNSLFFPRIAGDLSLPFVLKGRYREGLELLEQFLEVIVGKPYLREHLGVYYNSLGVLLAYNGRLYASYDALQRGLEVMGSLEGSEVYLRLLINLSDTALELEGPSASFKYVNAAFRSTAPCNLALRAVALSNYCATYFQFMGLPKEALEELISLMPEADTKTRFDVGEVVVGTYWLSGMGNLAKSVLTMMSAENDEQRFRYAVFQAALGLCSWSEESFPSIGLSSSFPLYPVMWLYKENPEKLKGLSLFSSDRPIVLFFRALRQRDTVENLMAFAVRAEHGWYLADAMFIYELLASLVEGEEKAAFLEEALRLATLLGFSEKARLLRKVIHELNIPLVHSMNLQMLEKSLLSLPLEQATISGFIKYLGNILSHFYEDFFLSISWGEEVYRTGRERVSGFSIDMYLPPFWGTLVVKNGNVADALVLKAVLLSVERVWGIRYGTNDALTGLFNRNFGLEVLNRLWSDYERNGRSFSVIFMDVDNLKNVNDTLGHPVGDQVLRQVSFALKKHIRQSDFAVRWGGDEFIVILLQSDLEGAEKVAERIKIELANSPMPVGVSYGIVEAKEVTTLEDLLRTSDERMYLQKRNKKERLGEDA